MTLVNHPEAKITHLFHLTHKVATIIGMDSRDRSECAI